MTVSQLLAGATTQTVVELGASNPVVNFSVDGSAVAPRRTVVALSNCNNCHVALSLHGNLRNNNEYCVLCHNPSNTDAITRAKATVASDKTAPPQGINFNLLVHRIHDGVNAAADGAGPKNPYIVVGYMGSHNDFSGTLFPAMSPTGEATYLQNCSMCHVNSTEQNDLPLMAGLNQVMDPQGWINPVQPISSACSGCHVSKPRRRTSWQMGSAATDSLGESCTVCHAAGAQFAVDAVHIRIMRRERRRSTRALVLFAGGGCAGRPRRRRFRPAMWDRRPARDVTTISQGVRQQPASCGGCG